MPETLKYIGSFAFFNCILLTYLDMSRSKVKKVKLGAFSNCNLKNVYFNELLEEIDVEAFSNNLFETITFPKNLKIIQPYAFKMCQNLKSITININTKINNYSFSDCISLKEINVYDNYNNIVYKIECNEDEYISNIQSFDNGLIVIKTNKNNDKNNTINILCDNQKFEYKFNDTKVDIENIKSLIKTRENVYTFNELIRILVEQKYDSNFINDIIYFSYNLNKVQKFLDTYDLSKSFINNTSTISERNSVLSLLDEINLFSENNEGTVMLLNILNNLDDESYRYNILKIFELINENTDIIYKIKIAQGINLEKYKDIIQYFDYLKSISNDINIINRIIDMFNNYYNSNNILNIKEDLLYISKITANKNKTNKKKIKELKYSNRC